MFKIEHLKSGLAISTHMGCPLGCSYCVLDTIPDYGTGVKRLAAPEDLVKKILDDEVLYLDGMTPIIINNRTDPFLPDVEPDTMVLLQLLSERKIKSPVILISKIIPKRSLAEFYD